MPMLDKDLATEQTSNHYHLELFDAEHEEESVVIYLKRELNAITTGIEESILAESGAIQVDLRRHGIDCLEVTFDSRHCFEHWFANYADEYVDRYEQSPRSDAMEFLSNEPDWISSQTIAFEDYPPMWAQRKCRFDLAWSVGLGTSNVIIGVVDTGINVSHEELLGVSSFLETLGDEIEVDILDDDRIPEDHDGHGTFIVGLLSSDSSNAVSILGLAPECSTVPIRASNLLSASRMRLIEGALLAADLGARVINYSWASTTPFAVEEEMCEILEEKGVLLVCSAGHHPDNFTMYPAAYDTAFSVGATDAFDDRVEQISNEGQYVDIAAPGLFIKSCWRDADDSYIEQGSGTSYAAAFVSGAAALLLSYDPTLTPAQIRELLVETGAPTTGFAGHEVRRLDVAAAFGQLTALEIEPKRMDSLVQSGLLELSPQITGNAQWCSVSARGTELARDDSAPFALEFDTSELPDGRHELLLQCGDGEGVAEARMPILVDNSAALPELAEDFDNSMQMFMGLDSRGLSDELLARLRQFGPAGWDAADLRGSRSRVWQRSDAVGDEYAATCLLAGEPGYRSWETAVLVSRPLDLTDASNPSLRFEAACNLEEGADFLRCLATVDNGATFSELQFRGAANALLTGELAPAQYELELAGYSAEQPRIVLLLETDGSTAGEVATDPGVWIDNIELRDEGSPAAASGAAALQAWSLSGQATDDGVLSLSLPSASAVDGVIYELDLAPFGSAGGDDLRVQVTDSSSDFAVELEHAALGNRLALLRIIPFSGVQTGQLREIPLWLFNRPGDANADGQVNETDLQFIRERSAVLPDSPLWLPFADSDFDGLITELDASAVGYNWGE